MTPAQKKVYDHVIGCLISGEYVLDGQDVKWVARTMRASDENDKVYHEMVNEGTNDLWDITWELAAKSYRKIAKSPLMKALS